MTDLPVPAVCLVILDGWGIAPAGEVPVPGIEEIALPQPRLTPPGSLGAICTSDPFERVLHAFGQSQPDSIRIFARDFGLGLQRQGGKVDER